MDSQTQELLEILTVNDGTGGRIVKTSVSATVAGTVKIEDSAGNALTSTAGALDVNIASGLANPLPVSLPSGAQVITSSLEVNSTNSPVAAGQAGVTFTTDATFAGTINGVARAASTVYSFTATEGKTLPAIAFTVTAGSLIIDKIV